MRLTVGVQNSLGPNECSHYYIIQVVGITEMSNRKSQGSHGSSILTGILGVGIGLLAGFVVNNLINGSDKQKQSNQPRNEVHNERNVSSISYDRQFKETPQNKLEQMMQCPITLQIMNEPMTIAQCGHSFEKKSIYEYVCKHGKCPMCRKQTNRESLVPNYQLRNVIQQYKQTKR